MSFYMWGLQDTQHVRKVIIKTTYFRKKSSHENMQSPYIKVTFFCHQTVTEKHKMNVPETMNEVLDMSDDEGMKTSLVHNH